MWQDQLFPIAILNKNIVTQILSGSVQIKRRHSLFPGFYIQFKNAQMFQLNSILHFHLSCIFFSFSKLLCKNPCGQYARFNHLLNNMFQMSTNSHTHAHTNVATFRITKKQSGKHIEKSELVDTQFFSVVMSSAEQTNRFISAIEKRNGSNLK